MSPVIIKYYHCQLTWYTGGPHLFKLFIFKLQDYPYVIYGALLCTSSHLNCSVAMHLKGVAGITATLYYIKTNRVLFFQSALRYCQHMICILCIQLHDRKMFYNYRKVLEP